MINLGELTGSSMYNVTWGINDVGTVVGVSRVNGEYVATEWSDGSASYLGGLRDNTSGQAYAINGAGQVVGSFYITRPEPSTWAMLLLGFAGLGFAGYRRVKAAKPASRQQSGAARARVQPPPASRWAPIPVGRHQGEPLGLRLQMIAGSASMSFRRGRGVVSLGKAPTGSRRRRRNWPTRSIASEEVAS